MGNEAAAPSGSDALSTVLVTVRQRGCGKGMFLVTDVCQSVGPQKGGGGGGGVAISVQFHPVCTGSYQHVHGPSVPASDIW